MKERVNFHTPVNKQLGYGIHGTSLAYAMSEIGIDIQVFPTEPVNPEMLEQIRELRPLMIKEPNLNALSINLSVGSLMHCFGGKFRIGYTVIEVDKLPESWPKQLNQLDDVWTVSTYCKEVFERSGVEKNVKIVPEGVDLSLFNPFVPKNPNLKSDAWKLLCVGKLEPRKNIDGVCKAWALADLPKDKAELYLMCDNPFVNYNPFEFLYNLHLPPHPPIKIIGRVKDYRLMPSIYKSMDAFISLTRAESWGLPIIEAMAVGIPVITTNATGQKDYISKEDTYLVEPLDWVNAYDPVFGVNINQGKWTEPDIKQASEHIRYIFEHREEANKLAMKASKRVLKDWTWEKAAEKALKILKSY